MRKALAALALLLSASVCAQNKSNQPANSQAAMPCELSTGIKMLAGHSGSTTHPEKSAALEPQIDFFTSANVVGAHGIVVPFGIYKASFVRNSDTWTLVMKQVAGDPIAPVKSGPEKPISLPMAVTKASSFSKTFVVSFDRAGETCTLRVNWQNTQASVEFAAKDGDLSGK